MNAPSPSAGVPGFELPSRWHGKPYYSLDAWCKNNCREKLYKIALDAGCTCPNRDGRIGTGGCLFCSAGGSGDFAAGPQDSLAAQLERGRRLFGGKKTGSRYIAYFQAYTNTYGDPDRLAGLYEEALSQPDVAGLSIATRPDCLSGAILSRICRLRDRQPDKFIWIELGLQTVHEKTAALIRRGYSFPVFEEAMARLRERELPAIVHLILGLPGETRPDMLATIRALNRFSPFGVKLQLLHVLAGTGLAALYEKGAFAPLSKNAYVDLVTDCIAALSPEICIHRVTGDGPRDLLLAPFWSLKKRDVLNSIYAAMKQKDIRQGSYYESGTFHSL